MKLKELLIKLLKNYNLHKFKGLVHVIIVLFASAITIAFTSGNTKPENKGLTAPNVFTAENSGLPSNNVNDIYIDSANVKWIGTGAGLARFDGGEWITYTISDHLLNNKVNDIEFEFTKYGSELWIATDSGLTVAAYGIDGITSATTYVGANSGLVGNKVNSVCVDKDHNRWISTDSAISVFRGNIWDSILTGIDAWEETIKLSDVKITRVAAYDAHSMTLAATEGKGILRYSYNTVDGITGASTYATPWSSMYTDIIFDINIKGDIQWYATDTGAYKHTSEATKDDWEYFSTQTGLVSNKINTVFTDKDNNIWFGTPAGLSVFTGSNWYRYTEKEGLVNNYVNCISSDTTGNIWVGTSGGIEWFSSIPGEIVIIDNLWLPCQDMAETIKIYPNPATDLFYLKVNTNNKQAFIVTTYSTEGRCIESRTCRPTETGDVVVPFDISDKQKYPAGTYFVKINGYNIDYTVKLNKTGHGHN